MIYAIDKVRENHKLPPYRWSLVELVDLGVPEEIAASAPSQELPGLVVENGWAKNWEDFRQLMM